MAKCTRKKVVIKSKRSGKKIAEFMAHQGSNCPKPKRSTAHLRPYKTQFKIEAKACKSRAKTRGKFSRKAYAHCIGQGMKRAFSNR